MILVTGATGRLGRSVVGHLLDRQARVRALVRPTSAIPGGWGEAELVTGDLDRPDSLSSALAGVETVVVVSPMTPWLDRQDAAVLDAAVAAGAGHVVKLSTTAPDPGSPISWWRAHWRAEERLRSSPLAWTILRPNGIAMFLLDFAAEVRASSSFATAGGAGRMALVDPDDVGEVAAAVALAPERWTGRTLKLSGPAALSYADVAADMSALLRRPVTHRELDPARALEHLHAAGVAGWEAEGVAANWTMTRHGRGGFARTTDGVSEVLGRPPRAVRDYLADHLDAFGGAA